jgi:hypothetical protein
LELTEVEDTLKKLEREKEDIGLIRLFNFRCAAVWCPAAIGREPDEFRAST